MPADDQLRKDPKNPVILDPRVALAAERTLLAWTRTGLALMGFGFVVARFGLFMRELTHIQQNNHTGLFSTSMGVVLVLVGVVINGFAAVMHAVSLGDRTTFDRRRRVSGWIGVCLTVFLALCGLAMAIYLLWNR
jgi:putative membrane protein